MEALHNCLSFDVVAKADATQFPNHKAAELAASYASDYLPSLGYRFYVHAEHGRFMVAVALSSPSPDGWLQQTSY